MQKQVLIVDPQVAASRDLVAALGALRPDWLVLACTDGSHALDTLGHTPCDAVVAELNLPDRDGASLLNEVMEHHPRTVRFVLSDLSRQDAVLKCIGRAHQFLAKPCDPQILCSALGRAFALDFWLPSEQTARALAGMQKLPSPPTLYFQVVRALRSSTASLEDVGALIARDPAMTAKILQVVNSAVFGFQRQVANPAEAVMYLGMQTTTSLILLAHTYSYFDQLGALNLSMDQLWSHSVRTARRARKISAAQCPIAEIAEEAYTAGMLHDIGKLALAANNPSAYQEIAARVKALGLLWWEAEQEVLGTIHSEIGACLAAAWGLSAGIIEAIALHHHPIKMVNSGFSPLTAVHAANVIDHSLQSHNPVLRLDWSYIADLGLSDQVVCWRELCAEDE